MIVNLSDELEEELRATLAGVISDMSSEIAGTDNPQYRLGLKERRQRLGAIVDSLGQLAAANGSRTSGATAAGEGGSPA
jgi:hypothetical protein